MEPMLQKKLITLFGYSLNSSGLMILGSAETIGNLISGFSEVEGKLKIFKKKPGGKLNELIDFPSSFYHNRAIVGKNEKPVAREVDNIQSVADQVLLQRFSPASVLVNENGDILYITGRTGSYLEPAAGKANWNIHAMDIKMPVMDGYEATREIRKFNKKVTIFAQTAFGMVTDRELSIAAGCNDYISKPIKQSHLIELIKNVLQE